MLTSQLDGGIRDDDTEVLLFVEKLVRKLEKGHKLYIHCWAGRGRTGIIVGCLLGMRNPLSKIEKLTNFRNFVFTISGGSTKEDEHIL